MTGGKVSKQDIFVPDLKQVQTGISIGGPIIKNKLFIFGNFELDDRDDLGSNYFANRGQGGDNVSRVTAADLDLVSSLLQTIKMRMVQAMIRELTKDFCIIQNLLKEY